MRENPDGSFILKLVSYASINCIRFLGIFSAYIAPQLMSCSLCDFPLFIQLIFYKNTKKSEFPLEDE